MKRRESYWFESLKFAEDDIQMGLEAGVKEVAAYEPPTGAFIPESLQNEFDSGYYAGLEHYKSLGIIK